MRDGPICPDANADVVGVEGVELGAAQRADEADQEGRPAADASSSGAHF